MRWGSIFWNVAARATGVLALGFVMAQPLSAQSDPVAQLKSFATFKEVDLAALAGGEILTQRGPLMKFRRGISGESCYVVRKPSSTTAKFIQTSVPPKEEDQGISFHVDIQLPVRAESFAKLELNSEGRAVRRLIDQTLAVTANKAGFAMSRAEAAEMEKTIKAPEAGTKTPAEITRTCWFNLIKGRAAQFQQSGLAQLAPYEMEGKAICPTFEMRSLVGEHTRIAKEFAALLKETGLDESVKFDKMAPAVNYCELLNWDFKSTFDVGTVFVKDLGEGRYQLLDCQYYSSGLFYVSLGFFELWPVKIDGQEATLVWRGDLLAAPTLEVTRGTERMAYGMLMMVEIKKAIKNSLKDIASFEQGTPR